MDFLTPLVSTKVYGLSIIWVYILVGVVSYVLIWKISNYLDRRAIYSKVRVERLEQEKRIAWRKRQSEIDPDIGPEEEKPREEHKSPYSDTIGKSSQDNRKFKKIFGMNNLVGKDPCSTGG